MRKKLFKRMATVALAAALSVTSVTSYYAPNVKAATMVTIPQSSGYFDLVVQIEDPDHVGQYKKVLQTRYTASGFKTNEDIRMQQNISWKEEVVYKDDSDSRITNIGTAFTGDPLTCYADGSLESYQGAVLKNATLATIGFTKPYGYYLSDVSYSDCNKNESYQAIYAASVPNSIMGENQKHSKTVLTKDTAPDEFHTLEANHAFFSTLIDYRENMMQRHETITLTLNMYKHDMNIYRYPSDTTSYKKLTVTPFTTLATPADTGVKGYQSITVDNVKKNVEMNSNVYELRGHVFLQYDEDEEAWNLYSGDYKNRVAQNVKTWEQVGAVLGSPFNGENWVLTNNTVYPVWVSGSYALSSSDVHTFPTVDLRFMDESSNKVLSTKTVTAESNKEFYDKTNNRTYSTVSDKSQNNIVVVNYGQSKTLVPGYKKPTVNYADTNPSLADNKVNIELDYNGGTASNPVDTISATQKGIGWKQRSTNTVLNETNPIITLNDFSQTIEKDFYAVREENAKVNNTVSLPEPMKKGYKFIGYRKATGKDDKGEYVYADTPEAMYKDLDHLNFAKGEAVDAKDFYLVAQYEKVTEAPGETDVEIKLYVNKDAEKGTYSDDLVPTKLPIDRNNKVTLALDEMPIKVLSEEENKIANALKDYGFVWNPEADFVPAGWATKDNGRVLYKYGEAVDVSALKGISDLYLVWEMTKNASDRKTSAEIAAGRQIPGHEDWTVEMIKAAIMAYQGIDEATRQALLDRLEKGTLTQEDYALIIQAMNSQNPDVKALSQEILNGILTIQGDQAMLADMIRRLECKESVVVPAGVGNATYEIVKNPDGTLTIRVHDLNGDKVITVPSSVNIGGTVYNVSKIADGAFKGQKELETVYVSDGILTIGNDAFNGCTGLKSIRLPKSLTSIGDRAFKDCTSLTQLECPENLQTIGASAFENCIKLIKVKFNGKLLLIKKRAFYKSGVKTTNFPKSLLKIEKEAFAKCSKLTKVSFNRENKMAGMGESVFANNKSLKTVYLPMNLRSIPKKSFYNCPKLTTVAGMSRVGSVGISAFEKDKSLKKITLPGALQKILAKAFYNCKSLKTVTIKSKALTTVKSKAFKKCHKKLFIKVPNKKVKAYGKLLKGKM